MNDGSIQIRKATPEDIPDLQSCARAAYSKYIDRMDKEPAPMNADFGSQIAQGRVYVALCQRQFVGYVVFYPEADHLHLENVAVLPTQTSKGIGKKLIEYVEHTARQQGLKVSDT